MKSKKQKYIKEAHFYNGAIDFNSKCMDCGKEPGDYIHFRNGGKICDNPDGSCSCGAWHSLLISKSENTKIRNKMLK